MFFEPKQKLSLDLHSPKKCINSRIDSENGLRFLFCLSLDCLKTSFAKTNKNGSRYIISFSIFQQIWSKTEKFETEKNGANQFKSDSWIHWEKKKTYYLSNVQIDSIDSSGWFFQKNDAGIIAHLTKSIEGNWHFQINLCQSPL